MRLLTIRFLLALLVVSGASFRAAGKSPEKLPGRSIETKQLPETIRRFVLRHYSNLSRFNYRWDKRFYYAFNDNGGYMLFSADGALRGFRYYLRQMPCELADLLPDDDWNTVEKYEDAAAQLHSMELEAAFQAAFSLARELP